MLTIQLHQLLFFAYHGLYEAEKINGNQFELDVDIELNISGGIRGFLLMDCNGFVA